MVREEGVSSLGRGLGPNVFRAVLMNASQLASYVFIHLFICPHHSRLTLRRYDFFKAELLKTSYFQDNIYCHFTASFAAVRVLTRDAPHGLTCTEYREPSLPRSAHPQMCLRVVS